jgi:hypothetical protein
MSRAAMQKWLQREALTDPRSAPQSTCPSPDTPERSSRSPRSQGATFCRKSCVLLRTDASSPDHRELVSQTRGYDHMDSLRPQLRRIVDGQLREMYRHFVGRLFLQRSTSCWTARAHTHRLSLGVRVNSAVMPSSDDKLASHCAYLAPAGSARGRR